MADQMLRAIGAAIHSVCLRFAFCSQGEHKRETVVESVGTLHWRCNDCGAMRMLGTVFVGASNRKVKR